MIYLDNGATTLRKPECVKEALLEAMASMGNSGRGVHDASLYAGRTIYRARESLAELLGAAAPEQVVFTAIETIMIQNGRRSIRQKHLENSLQRY